LVGVVIPFYVRQILSNVMTVATLSFFSRISDSRFGGTYMTLLNTLSNLGHAWSSSVAIGTIDLLTYKQCSFDSDNDCSTKQRENVSRTENYNYRNEIRRRFVTPGIRKYKIRNDYSDDCFNLLFGQIRFVSSKSKSINGAYYGRILLLFFFYYVIIISYC